ncbi:MAG: aminomethyl-transferring glycine dehydrogenase subunit GcvPB [Pseudomonadota bacterium]
MLIFEKSVQGRAAQAQSPHLQKDAVRIDSSLLRQTKPCLPEVSELETVRHFTNLSRKNFSIDTNFYPLGSCTMKYNPRAAHQFASDEKFLNQHPYIDDDYKQGTLQCLYELQHTIKSVTGMTAVSLTPMAGAQGEFAGVAMIRAYHDERGDKQREEIIVPDAAHGTNPATAFMCGYKVREVATLSDSGDVDLTALKAVLSEKTAGIMLTNPSTLGVFERKIKEIADLTHEAGGLLYYDGANLNAIMGKVRPGDMGFDVMHLNLHKTFATPHGGGGPGAGPVAANSKLAKYLPVPVVQKTATGRYILVDETHYPHSIGKLSTFFGNTGVLIRAYIYAKMLGGNGLTQASTLATLNANYLMTALHKAGFTLAYPQRRASHEFIITLEPEHKIYGITALDVAKCLLDRGIHAPTMYFPLLVAECLLIEPTETESKQQLDEFVDAMIAIRQMMIENAEQLKQAPQKLPVTRLDEVKAAKTLDLVWSE